MTLLRSSMQETSQGHFLERISGVFFRLDEEGKVLYLNEAWEARTGIPRKEVEGAELLDHIKEHRSGSVRELLQELRERPMGQEELTLFFPNRRGEEIPFRALFRAKEREGEGVFIEGIAERSEEGFSKDQLISLSGSSANEELYRCYPKLIAFAESSYEPLLECDRKGELHYMNPAAFEFFKERGEPGSIDLLPEQHFELAEHVLRTGKKREREVNYGDRVLSWLYYPGGTPGSVHIRGHDISHHKNMEAELLDAVIRGKEEERERFARELHEEVGQQLSAAIMHFGALSETLSPEQRQKGEYIEELIRRAFKDVRSISQSLMPRILKEFGLAAALGELHKGQEKALNIPVSLRVSFSEERMGEGIKLGLYRLLKELVEFSASTRKARKCFVELFEQDDGMVLEYKDEGGQQDPSTGASFQDFKKFNSMVRSMNGQLTLEIEKGERPKARVRVPLP